MRHETFLPQKKNFQFAQSTNKKQIRWRSLMFLLRGWTLLPLNDNCLENSFDWFHWPNKERIQYLRNFLFSVERSKKSSEIRLFFAANYFVFFQLELLSLFFKSNNQLAIQMFFCTSSQKWVANMVAACKKSCRLWQKSKAFSFPSKANTVRDKETSCVTSTSKTMWKTFLKHQSLSVSQKASSHNVYICFYNHFCILHRDLCFKNYVSFVGQD